MGHDAAPPQTDALKAAVLRAGALTIVAGGREEPEVVCCGGMGWMDGECLAEQMGGFGVLPCPGEESAEIDIGLGLIGIGGDGRTECSFGLGEVAGAAERFA